VLPQALGDEHPPGQAGPVVLDVPYQLGRGMPQANRLEIHARYFLLPGEAVAVRRPRLGS
jgi:hypothetical protein